MEKTKKNGFWHRVNGNIISILLLISMVFTMISCNSQNPSKLVGIWQLSVSSDRNWSDIIVLQKDGTGENDDNEFTWKVEKKQLYLLAEGMHPEYEMSLNKNEITLKASVMGMTSVASYKKLTKEGFYALDDYDKEIYLESALSVGLLNKADIETILAILGEKQLNKIRESISTDLLNMGVNIQQYFRTPTILGGGGGSIGAGDLPKLMAFINNGNTRSSIFTPNGDYNFTLLAPDGVRIEMKNVPAVGGWTALAIVAFDGRMGNGFERGIWTYVGESPAKDIPTL